MIRICTVLCFALTWAWPGCLDNLGLGVHEKELDSALALTQLGQYATAENQLQQIPGLSDEVRNYFIGLLNVQRFEDLGDTAALNQAEIKFNLVWKLPTEPTVKAGSQPFDLDYLLAALSGMQLGYIAGVWHHNVLAARYSLQSKARLKKIASCPEASGGLAVFEYYQAEIFSHLPFYHSDPHSQVLQVQNALRGCRRLRPIFLNATIWMLFDNQQYESAMIETDQWLARYPKNRIYRQIKGDLYYREGKFDSALSVYRAIYLEYQALQIPIHGTQLPLGYLCADGNLARIHDALGAKDSAKYYLNRWNSPQYEVFRPWLPQSLRKALKSLSP